MTNYEKFKAKQLKDPEIKKEYDNLNEKYDLIKAVIQARIDLDLTQAELAKKIGTAQSNISRFESGNYNPSFKLLEKIANCLGKKLKISLV